MPLFQRSVLKKYLSDINKAQLQSSWQLFQQHFFNPSIQQNIRDSKEEEYQEGFVRDLFVKVLGYTLNPQPDYNFVLEKKTVTDATKSDGAILLNNDVIGVVELKDTGTPDLDKVSNQAFGYKHKHKNCIYVITSNFEKLRFYINDSTDYEEFDLFTLTQEKFAVLWLCLQKQNLLSNVPLQIKQQSLVQEQNVTKELYDDYSLFKRNLFQNIIDQNTQYDKLLLFKKTQKLLDRFLFIRFAQDRLLLSANSFAKISTDWQQLKDLDNYVPLYSRFKKYFGYLNAGHHDKQHEIFAYNGGLFMPDDILDSIVIDDTVLSEGTKALSKYDFETEVDVNILGHIFEHSLTEIEELQQELEGKAIEKNKTKRKKEGVFYTPRYITKYIVENTLGVLCTQKKEELKINEEAFTPKKRKNRKKILLNRIETYRNWLLQLTICDLACGSGAFLNAALEYLKAEHRTADELIARMLKVPIVFSDLDNSILEKNLYGVDINEDAIEIAKLSLWLHTAKIGRKLSNLSNNIKCGNSLIDDAIIAGDKAFKWNEEFKSVFDNGGFDVVIGNPPYVRNELIAETDKKYFEREYETFTGKSDLYVYFFEKALNCLKPFGLSGFIVSSKYTKTKYGKVLIEYLNHQASIISFIDFKDLDVFNGIIAYPSTIILENVKPEKKFTTKLLVVSELNIERVSDNLFEYDIVPQSEVFQRLGSWTNNNTNGAKYELFTLLKSKFGSISSKPQVGIKTGLNSAFIFNKDKLPVALKNSIFLKPYILGKEVKRYTYIKPQYRLFLPYKMLNNKLLLIKDFGESEYAYYNILKDKLSKRAIIKEGIISGNKKWYELQQIKTDFNYSNYIIYPDISHGTNFTLVKDIYYDMTCFGIENNQLELLGILNSRLIKEYLEMVCVKARGGYLRLKSQYITSIPIPDNIDNEKLKKQVESIMAFSNEEKLLIQQFTQLLQSKFEVININNKLQNWANLTSNEFFKELEKQKIKLSLAEQKEWLQYFEEQQTTANNIQQVIQQTDKEIDRMVYGLYGLSEEEIKIIEE